MDKDKIKQAIAPSNNYSIILLDDVCVRWNAGKYKRKDN